MKNYMIDFNKLSEFIRRYKARCEKVQNPGHQAAIATCDDIFKCGERLYRKNSELSGSGQNSTAAFEKWWDTGVHGWGNEKLAEYKLAKDAWLAALSCGETNKQSTPCKKMISCGLLYDSELCDNGFRECYE